MPKYGICQWCVPGENRARKIAFSAELGLEGMELELGSYEDGFDLASEETMAACLQASADHGISLPSLAANALCRHGMSRPESEPAVQEVLHAAVHCAQKLSIPLIQLPSFINGAIANQYDLTQTAKCLRYACDRASEYGIVIGTENALSGEDNLKLLEIVDRQNLSIYFDTRNPKFFANLDGPSVLRSVLPHVCEVHVKDGIDGNECRFLGEGNSGFAESMSTLDEGEYGGWIILENDYQALAKKSKIVVGEAIRQDLDKARILLP